jgi:hypothetical protein
MTKRGSDENLFSVSGAADALDRSRRTVAKALKGIPPDAVRSGLSLWRMQTIIHAVNTRTQAPITPRTGGSNEVSDETFAAQSFAVVEDFTRASDALEELQKMRSLKARRAEARHVFAKMERLKEAFEASEPDGLTNTPREVLAAMFSGLMNACDFQLTDD